MTIRHSCYVVFFLTGFLASCSGSGPVEPVLDPGLFLDPPVEYRPWVRWWWPGADVEAAEIEREVELLAANGFGGFELQAFNAALDPEASQETLDRRLAFDTERYYGLVSAALQAAREKGLQVDLTFGSGWPPGGVHLAPSQSLKTLMWNEWPQTGPAGIEITLEPVKTVFYRIAELIAGFDAEMARFMPEHAEVLCVLAAEVTGGSRSGSLLDLKDQLELDPDSVIRLDDQVGDDGVLRWQVPAGDWQVIALFVAPDGETPTLPAQAGEAFVVDHLDGDEVGALLDRFFGESTGLAGFFGDPLRALFTDSFEFKAERFVSTDFLSEFEHRRGYDVAPWLPAVLVPGADNFIFEAGRLDRAAEFSFGPDDRRIRYDYTLTISELFTERYLGTIADWAESRGLASRAQTYGADIDAIGAARVVQLPESEQLYAGGSELFLRIATSAGLLYDRNRISAESLVFPQRDYMTTPAKIKAAADKLFVNGINHLVYHGFPYDHPGDYGQGGWSAFSSRYGGTNTFSCNLGEHTALFAHLEAINRYVSRCQFLMRQGRPEVDLLIVYPWLGFPTSLALEPDFSEPLLGGWVEGEPELREQPFAELAALFGEPVTDPRAAWLMALQPVLEDLQSRGFTWAWLDPASLAEADERDDRIVIRGSTSRAVLLFDTGTLQAEIAEKLSTLAGDGVRVTATGKLPDAQPGFLDHEARDRRVVEAMDELSHRGSFRKAANAGGVLDTLEDLGVKPSIGFGDPPSGLRLFRRRLGNKGQIIFVRNPSAQEQVTALSADGGCREGYWLDAWSGKWARADKENGAIPLKLDAFGSRFLVCGDGPADETRLGEPGLPEPLGAGAEVLELDTWRLEVTGEDVVGDSFDEQLAVLVDWREIENLRQASSPGSYQASFRVGNTGDRIELDLGWVAGLSARVELNGEEIAALLVPPFRCNLDNHVQNGVNELTVVVEPAWRNRFVGLGAAGDERYSQFTGKEDTLIQTGLLGPVRLRCTSGAGCAKN